MKWRHFIQLALIVLMLLMVFSGCIEFPRYSSISLSFLGKTLVETEVRINGESYIIPSDGVLKLKLTEPASVSIEGVVWKEKNFLLAPGDSAGVDLEPEDAPRAWVVRYADDPEKAVLIITQPSFIQALEVIMDGEADTSVTMESSHTIEASYTLFTNGRFVGWAKFSAIEDPILELLLPASVQDMKPLKVSVVGINSGEPEELYTYPH